MYTKKTYFSVLTITLVLLACVCYGKGPDDGLSIAGESLYERDNVDLDENIPYIIMKAKAQSKQKNNSNTGSGDQDGSIGNVILAPGATIKGDVYNIDLSKGNKTAITVDK